MVFREIFRRFGGKEPVADEHYEVLKKELTLELCAQRLGMSLGDFRTMMVHLSERLKRKNPDMDRSLEVFTQRDGVRIELGYNHPQMKEEPSK